MWALGVVVDAPALYHDLRLFQAVEDLAIEAFIPEFCSVVPASLQAAARLLPCPCRTSICRSFVTICSAPNRRPLGIAPSPSRLILSSRLVQKRPVRSHWAREIAALGHEVRLMPPQFVKPYVKSQKNDAADAEAICEAVQRDLRDD